MLLNDDELSEQYTLADDVESDDGDGKDYVKNASGTRKKCW